MEAIKSVKLGEQDWKYILRVLDRDLGEQRRKALHYPDRATMQLMAKYSIDTVEQIIKKIEKETGVKRG